MQEPIEPNRILAVGAPSRGYRPIRAGSLLALFTLTLFFASQSQSLAQDEAPLTNRPEENFYHAQGSSVKVAWQVSPTTVTEGGELTATLVITGATNPKRIVRPDLKKLAEFQSRFIITDTADPKPDPGAKEVRFSYQLQPQRRSVNQVPALLFYFYNPSAAVGKKQFPSTTAASVPITVTEAPKAAPPPIPLHEPDYLFAIATGPSVLERPTSFTGVWPWLAVGLGGPVLALAWFVAWRRVYPNTMRLASKRRSRAARRAIDIVRRANRANDPPAVIAAAVLDYLRMRYPLPPGAATPGEIAAALRNLNVPDDECALAGELFRSCDAARFAPAGDREASLAADAEAVVARLEAL